MTSLGDYTEDALVEQPALALFAELGWQTANCYEETFGPGGSLGRQHRGEVLLHSRLLPALQRLNPGLPPAAYQLALEELERDRSLVSPAHANQQIYQYLKDGLLVAYRDPDGLEVSQRLALIDWQHPEHNDFFLASQFWITGELHTRRPDLVGFVNGLPLLLIELKAAQVHLKHAYTGNLRDYKDTIPHLFWYNAFIILSNGSATRLVSLTSQWEHFSEWKRINAEGEQGLVSLETALRGLCAPARLLDYLENFTLFVEAQGGLRKIVAKNHQYLGVNNAFASLRRTIPPSPLAVPSRGRVAGGEGFYPESIPGLPRGNTASPPSPKIGGGGGGGRPSSASSGTPRAAANPTP